MTDEDYKEMEQMERQKHDDKLQEIADERKRLEKKAEEYCNSLIDFPISPESMGIEEIIDIIQKKSFSDGYKQGQNDKHQIVCDGCVDYGMLQKENAELKAQIEKMKCCGNCLYQYCIDTDEPCCKCKINLDSKIKEDKWSLGE